MSFERLSCELSDMEGCLSVLSAFTVWELGGTAHPGTPQQGSWGPHLSLLSGSHFADEGTQVNSGEVSSSWPFQASSSRLEEKAGRAPLSAESHGIPKG